MRFGGLAMSVAVSMVILLAAGRPAIQAQTGDPIEIAERKNKKAERKKAAPRRRDATKPKDADKNGGKKKANGKRTDGKKAEQSNKRAPKSPPARAYDDMPVAERAAIQFDLNWTKHYSGQADGEFGDRSIAAVKAFQKERGFQDTGVLTESEREALATLARNRRAGVGWRMAEDPATGAQLGLPTTRTKHMSRVGSGTRWQSAQGQLQIETFRIREPGATLATVFEDQKKEPPNRKVASSSIRGDHFVLTGMQGLKYFLVRAEIRDLEIRGVTVLYDQAIENTTDYVALAVLSAFAPFPGTGAMALIGPPSRRKIDYGTGIVVTDEGHVVTDHQITEGCSVLQIAGHGDASRLKDHDNLSLLRVFGASDLTPAAIVHAGAAASPLTLVGIADPQAQGGARTVTTTAARLDDGGLKPTPPLGFAGAAAVDKQGRIFGMVALKAPVFAGAGTTTLPPATVVPVGIIRQLLDSQYVTPAVGRAGIDAAKASVVRVICVRK